MTAVQNPAKSNLITTAQYNPQAHAFFYSPSYNYHTATPTTSQATTRVSFTTGSPRAMQTCRPFDGHKWRGWNFNRLSSAAMYKCRVWPMTLVLACLRLGLTLRKTLRGGLLGSLWGLIRGLFGWSPLGGTGKWRKLCLTVTCKGLIRPWWWRRKQPCRRLGGWRYWRLSLFVSCFWSFMSLYTIIRWLAWRRFMLCRCFILLEWLLLLSQLRYWIHSIWFSTRLQASRNQALFSENKSS